MALKAEEKKHRPRLGVHVLCGMRRFTDEIVPRVTEAAPSNSQPLVEFPDLARTVHPCRKRAVHRLLRLTPLVQSVAGVPSRPVPGKSLPRRDCACVAVCGTGEPKAATGFLQSYRGRSPRHRRWITSVTAMLRNQLPFRHSFTLGNSDRPSAIQTLIAHKNPLSSFVFGKCQFDVHGSECGRGSRTSHASENSCVLQHMSLACGLSLSIVFYLSSATMSALASVERRYIFGLATRLP